MDLILSLSDPPSGCLLIIFIAELSESFEFFHFLPSSYAGHLVEVVGEKMGENLTELSSAYGNLEGTHGERQLNNPRVLLKHEVRSLNPNGGFVGDCSCRDR